MSRTLRRDRQYKGKTIRDGKHRYKCRCEWCINIEWRDRSKEKGENWNVA